jgi:hypothetical protein
MTKTVISADHELLKGCGFIDLGAGHGGCTYFASKKLKGGKSLCFEALGSRVNELQSRGFPAIKADITELELPPKCVRFVTMSHILEHMYSLDAIFQVLQTAASAAKDFLYIECPTFDFDDYLQSKFLKFFWRDSCGHHYPITIKETARMLDRLNIFRYDFLVETPLIRDSSSLDILPYGIPATNERYSPAKHGNKDRISFDRPLYRSWICVASIKQIPYIDEVLRARPKFVGQSSYSNMGLNL